MNQVVMSEEERDRIIQEHEKNLAELESRYYALLSCQKHKKLEIILPVLSKSHLTTWYLSFFYISLTLTKLRQRQMLEEKLSKRRKRRMEQLEKRQVEETKVRRHFEDYKFISVKHY